MKTMVCCLVAWFLMFDVQAADVSISVGASASVSSRSESIQWMHLYGIQYPPTVFYEYVDGHRRLSPIPVGEDGQMLTEESTHDSAAQAQVVQPDCPTAYRADIVFEARKKRIEGVGANKLFEFLSNLNESAYRGCRLPAKIRIVAFACIGCDKLRKQPDSVVEDLAKERAKNLADAVAFIIESRKYTRLNDIRFVPSTVIVNIPALGVTGKTALIEGFVEEEAQPEQATK